MNKQSAAIAMAVAKKMKAKKMSQGGWVEPEPMEHNVSIPNAKENYSEVENLQSDASGPGFDMEHIDGHQEMDNIEPRRFAMGGQCYATGGMVEVPDDEDMADKRYPEHMEENQEVEHGLQSPPMKFVHSYIAAKALKRARSK